jgi:integrase
MAKQRNMLASATARAQLAPGVRHWRHIKGHLALGYYRGSDEGSWYTRIYKGRGDGRRSPYDIKALGRADDEGFIADGAQTLSYEQAVDKATERYEKKKDETPEDECTATVGEIVADYVKFLERDRPWDGKQRPRAARETEQRVKLFFGSLYGKRVTKLTQEHITDCLEAMIRRDPDDDGETERRSKDSANRVLTMFKAALNRAFKKKRSTYHIPSDIEWRTVEPYKKVGRRRDVIIGLDEVKALIQASEGRFRDLLVGTFLSGCRPPHELAHMRVKHFHHNERSLDVPKSKTGERTIMLSDEAFRFFDDLCKGRGKDEYIFVKDDGERWGWNHHIRPMSEVAVKAKLPDVTIYAMRHAHASLAILNGANLKSLATHLGTSVRMLELHYLRFIEAAQRKIVQDTSPKLGLYAAEAQA